MLDAALRTFAVVQAAGIPVCLQHPPTPPPPPGRSDAWNGGYRAPGGAQVDGAFARSAFLVRFGDSVGRAFVLRARSSGNALRNGDVGEVTAGGRAVGWDRRQRAGRAGRRVLLRKGGMHRSDMPWLCVPACRAKQRAAPPRGLTGGMLVSLQPPTFTS